MAADKFKPRVAEPFGPNRPGITVLPPLPTTKCPMCGQIFPTDTEHFLFEDGKPKGPCLECIRTMPLREKVGTVKQAATDLMFAMAQSGFAAPKCVDFYSTLVEMLGGVNEICKLWSAAINEIAHDPRSNKKALLQQFSNIFKMGQAVQSQGQEALNMMSDKQLEESIQRLVQKREGTRTRLTTGKIALPDEEAIPNNDY